MTRLEAIMHSEDMSEDELLENHCPGDFISDLPCTFVGNCPIEESNYELDARSTCRKCWEEEL